MSASGPSPVRPTLVSRHLTVNVRLALEDTRVAVILGARQVGKSTLIEQIAASEPHRTIVTLDNPQTRQAALEDPTGFIADLVTPAAIDEVQRAPALMLAIKESVDRDQRPGRYILTGSANLLTAPTIADALTGRTEYLRLWPFSQAELHGTPPRLIDALFAGRPPRIVDAESGRRPHAEPIVAGGFPEVQRRSSARRSRFFDTYVDTVLDRDLGTIARVHDSANVRRLLYAIAATTGSPLNVEGISRDLDITANTIRAHVDLLEMLFLIHRLPAWHTNLLSRLTKAPKLHIIDSGLLTYLLGADARRVVADGRIGGAAIETFGVMEIVRQAAAHPDPPRLFHLRDQRGHEVDLVMERRDGTIVGIEIKASATTGPNDFRGLKLLRDRLGERFVYGVIIHTGSRTLSFGDRLAAVPLAALWTA